MYFKEKLLEFIDELMCLFENNNIVFKRLILAHHRIRNEFDEKEMDLASKLFLLQNKERIEKRDANFLDSTPFQNDFNLIWDGLTTQNKMVVWKWIDAIISQF